MKPAKPAKPAIILATLCFGIGLVPKPAQAQAAVPYQAALSACRAHPVACAVVGAYIIWQYGPKYYCTAAGCVPTATAPSRIQGGDDQYNEPGVREIHAVSSPELCRQMLEKFKMQGRNLKLTRIARTTNPTLRYDCIFEGPDAVEGWFNSRHRRYR